PEPGTVTRAADPQTPRPGTPAPTPSAPRLQPVAQPENLDNLRRGVSEALKAAPGGLPRSLGALPHMATNLRLEGGTLHWFFPPNVRNTVQDLEREQANPHLLEALRQVLPGLTRVVITFEDGASQRPEDLLRNDPAFQRLMQETQGEILEVKRIEK
ncbi:MAG: hypothetical protein H6Q00_456, partial [Holophagaceae bacterium]|nr:hypothetical protein [Holophagaceae bacterium]